MQKPFIQSSGSQLIVNKNQLTMYAVAAAVLVVVIVLVLIALKRRKKGFIKTIPTNLKDEV